MAIPPTPVPGAAAGPDPMAAAGAPAAAPGDMAEADEGAEPEVMATICKNSDGTFTLYAGDEPEESADAGMPDEGGAAPEGKSFDTPQALLKGVMELLNGDSGAEEAFAGGFAGDAEPAPMK